MNSNIIKATPFDEKITIIIHLNYSCNFKCSYCIAGLEVSNDYLSIEDIDTLFNTITRLYHKYNDRNIEVDINGGDPTIHKDFVYTVTKFLTINNIKLQVSTNGYLIYSLREKLFNNDVIENKSKLRFNISFHYFEYKDKLETFVKSLNTLIEKNITFNLKFLVPDKNESIDEFLKVRDYIVDNTGVDEKNFKYYLIMNFKGGISKTYDKKMLDFYYDKKNKSNNTENKKQKNSIKESFNKDTEIKKAKVDRGYKSDGALIEYSSGEEIAYSQEELKANSLNNFKGFDCFYITDKIALIYIDPKGIVTFGSCVLLDKKKFHLNELEEVLLSGGRSLLCTHSTCTSGLNLPKVKSVNYNKIKDLELLLSKSILKLITDIELEDIQIALNDRIFLLFKLGEYNINLIIEKIDSGEKYNYSENDIGYSLRIKDNSNIIHNINNIDKKYSMIINKNIAILSKLNFLYKKII